jgi:hypothetical protein
LFFASTQLLPVGSFDPVFVQVRSGKEDTNGHHLAAVFIFNTGEHILQRTYKLEAFGINSPIYIYDWNIGQPLQKAADRISVTL